MLTADDIGCLEFDDESDNLALVFVIYYSDHVERPESDKESESEDNYYWGDWVMNKVNSALREIAKQLNERRGGEG